jgi:hypothetical protein
MGDVFYVSYYGIYTCRIERLTLFDIVVLREAVERNMAAHGFRLPKIRCCRRRPLMMKIAVDVL